MTEPSSFDIAAPALPYYDRLTDADAMQMAREVIEEWDYDRDPHGYCHDRPVLMRLLRLAEAVL